MNELIVRVLIRCLCYSSAGQWSLPLPTRAAEPVSSRGSSSSFDVVARAAVRTQLVHAYGTEPTDEQIERVLAAMGDEEPVEKEPVRARVDAVAISIRPEPTNHDEVKEAESEGSIRAAAGVDAAAGPVCEICWDPVTTAAGEATTDLPSCKVSTSQQSVSAPCESRQKTREVLIASVA